MIDINILNEEILDLESRETSYEVIRKLAVLYIVREHLGSAPKNVENTSISKDIHID